MTKNQNIAESLDLADSLLKEGKVTEAVDFLETLHQSYPEEESVLLHLAWALWDQGDKERSLQLWEVLLDRELQRKIFTGFAYDELTRIYKQEGLLARLVALCEKAARVQPEDLGILEELGKACLLCQQNDKACEIFRKLTFLENDHPVFYRLLGEALIAKGDLSAAEEAFQQAVLLDPDEADRYLFQVASLYSKKGHFQEAKKLLEQCLQIAPLNSLYYCALGDLFIALEQPEDAFATYEMACLHNSIYAAAYYHRLGNSFLKANFFEKAVFAFEKALSLDNSLPCQENLETARHGRK